MRNISCTLFALVVLLADLEHRPQAAQHSEPVLALGDAGQNGSSADWKLTLQIRQALAHDPEIGPLNPTVAVRNGVVTLSGPVPSLWFRRRAEELVRATKGVRGIRNELAPRPTAAPVSAGGPRKTPPLESLPRPLLGPPVPSATKAPVVANLASQVEIDPSPAATKPRTPADSSDLAFALDRWLRNNSRFGRVAWTLCEGQVRLSGSVRSPADRDDLVNGLRQLEGVNSVHIEALRITGQ